jgi:serine/threonine protein kinase
MLDALEYLHEDRAYVHRDVKPGNILLDKPRVNAVLADLGSAGRIDPDTGTAPDYGGTPLYLAPEAKPTGQVTVRSDLYSLGVVTVEMLAGRFQYEDISPVEVDSRLAAGKRALVDRRYGLPPHVPPSVGRFVGSLLRVEPARRPDSAGVALRNLNRLQYVDWQRNSGTGLAGEWIGTWPLHKRPEKRRKYRVHAVEVSRGRHAGRLRLTAEWQRPGHSWRSIRTLACYTDTDGAKALAKFFRDVELAAQSSPA